MSSRRLGAVLVVIVGACVPPAPEQLAPVAVRSTRSRAEIVQVATRELTAAGFEISASDTSAGTVTAKRTREKRGNFDYITCKFAENSLAETNLVSTLTVNVEPAPIALSTVMSPPMACAMRWLIASPRPVPP